MDRRQALGFLAAGFAAAATQSRAQPVMIGASRKVPASGEAIPVVGLGTWLTFDVGGADSPARRSRGEILKAFLDAGGRLVDSSPRYGSSEEVPGAEAARAPAPRLFSPTKWGA